MLNSISSAATSAYSSVAVPHQSSGGSTQASAATQSSSSNQAVTISISPNAQRLQNAEANLSVLESSGASLTGVWNANVTKSLIGLNTEQVADAQVAGIPSSDTNHIQQAQSAQAYVKAMISSQGNGTSVPNPFSGMSVNSLASIISDNSGLYTDYEKSAAFYAFNDYQNAWVQPAAAQGQSSGNWQSFYKQAITQYNDLPTIIQATYPPDYLSTITGYADGTLKETPSGTAQTTDPAVKMLQQIEASIKSAEGKAVAEKAVSAESPAPSPTPSGDGSSGAAPGPSVSQQE